MMNNKFVVVLGVFLVVKCVLSAQTDLDLTYKSIPESDKDEKNMNLMNDYLKDQRVVLKPPSLLQSFFTSSSNIYLIWDAPHVYPIHDVNASDTSWDEDNTTLPSNITDDNITDITTTSTSGVTFTDLGTTSVLPTSDNGTVITIDAICRSYDFLYNRTNPGDYLPVEQTSTHVANHAVTVKTDEEKDNMTAVTINISEAVAPFSQGCIEQYVVYVYNDKTDELVQTQKLGGHQPTELNIADLEASTTYRLLVAAEFTSGHKLNSTSITVTTKAGKDKDCECNREGTIGGFKTCRNDNSSSYCICKPGYIGLFCEICQPGFYKTALFFPCHPCPCRPYNSFDSTCRFVEGFLVCDKCRTGYTGNLCHQCANGYYRYQGKYCVPCRCHGNTDRNAHSVCDPYSGACVSCARNTTGFNCERCREGYKGDAILYKNCTAESDLKNDDLLPLPAGYIAGIVIGVILFFSFILGFIVYKRWKYPTMKPFWTVELKEDHEGVSFSPVDDQEFLKAAETRNKDGQFYEKQGGGMKYAQLREDI